MKTNGKFRKFAFGCLVNTKLGLDKIFKSPYPRSKQEIVAEFAYREYSTLQLAGIVSALAVEAGLLLSLIVSCCTILIYAC